VQATLPNAGFDFAQRPRLVCGAGVVERVGELAQELGCRRALLVTDPGIVQAGHAARVLNAFDASGISVVTYDQARENPGTRDVDACLAVARSGGVDLIVGLGGGSAMDTAKGCNFLLSNGGKMRDYWHTHAASRPFLPLIAIPTTAGTGSECQSYALIVDEESHQKMACGDAKALARVALLDPTLTTTQPRRVAACTGLDALVHAVETMVTTRRNAVSRLFAREAFALVQANLPLVFANPGDLAARGAMQQGAAFAGLAIENSMLGAAHACANPLTARFGMVHGHAVSTMLPAVLRHNAGDPATAALYAELSVHAGLAHAGDGVAAAVQALAKRIDDLIATAGLPRRLADSGVKEADIPALAADAAGQWTGRFNPRPVGEAEFRTLYAQALSGSGL
jgi:alcohol dehydrogenase